MDGTVHIGYPAYHTASLGMARLWFLGVGEW